MSATKQQDWAKRTYPYPTMPCSACGAPIVFARSANDRPIPLNAEPDPNGNIWVSADGRAHYRSKANPIPDGAERYTSHFIDCPQAAQFRRRS